MIDKCFVIVNVTMSEKLVVSYDSATCPLCLNVFHTPKLLHCSHCLCLACVEKSFAFQVLKRDIELSPSNTRAKKVTDTITILCPVCAEETILSKDCEIDKELKTNNNLHDVCSKLRELGVICESCGDKQATIKCLNCDVPFCESCFDLNHTTVILKRHKRVKLSDDDPVKYCEQHRDQKIKLFCVQCEQVICMECTYQTKGHKGHDCITISEYIDECRKEILKADTQLSQSQESVIRRRDLVDTKIKDFEEQLFSLKLKSKSLQIVENQIHQVRQTISQATQTESSMKMIDTKEMATKLMYDLGIQMMGEEATETTIIESKVDSIPSIRVGRFKEGEKRFKIIL